MSYALINQLKNRTWLRFRLNELRSLAPVECEVTIYESAECARFLSIPRGETWWSLQTGLYPKLIGPHWTLQIYPSSHINWSRGPNTQSLEVTLPEGSSMTGVLKTLKVTLRKSEKPGKERMIIPSPQVDWQGQEVKGDKLPWHSSVLRTPVLAVRTI